MEIIIVRNPLSIFIIVLKLLKGNGACKEENKRQALSKA